MQRSNSSDDKTDQERKVLLEFEVGKPKRTKVSVCQGDITKERVDAISNAANERLDHAGGVAGAILKAGGYSIQKESHDIIQREGRYINKAEVVYTKAGNLPCKWVLHVVGPVWNERNTDKVKEFYSTVVSIF
ncbi:uncharacterized protein TM_0508-like [Ptychodera flava]|uniref:uncharacterized protein TM_0508-like n=1 Tax=Ptychodera flava TaxID=63121 RepID=UPI003969F36E